jgi:hypothetical protein
MVFDVHDSWFVVQASLGISTPSPGILQRVDPGGADGEGEGARGGTGLVRVVR